MLNLLHAQPAGPAAPASALSHDAHPVPPPAEREYPYYGNTPTDMLPFNRIEPYERYWLTRLPFRGPGSNYPDPTDLKSLKVGLLTSAMYGPEGARGQRTRQGVLLAFE
ncbi:MAG: hypothetical protein KGS61_17530, partial [Verrucomicrobia bacterium]|nr:hypothetical protein [Verrucomicrobiota bacterium]